MGLLGLICVSLTGLPDRTTTGDVGWFIVDTIDTGAGVVLGDAGTIKQCYKNIILSWKHVDSLDSSAHQSI